MTPPLLESRAPFPCRRGKVRDVYDLGDTLAIVVTDRISAFDWVMPAGIPGKGRVLTAITKYWLNFLQVPNHFLSDDLKDLPPAFRDDPDQFAGRTMLVKKATVIPYECVARGYLAGSGWKEYRDRQTVCGLELPYGLKEASPLPEPIFTPATKAESGHDVNIPFIDMATKVGWVISEEMRQRTLEMYRKAAFHALWKGLILADTKFEFGTLPNGDLILIDEVLTPDSSRYWPRGTYAAGQSPPSFDKQYLRDWLETTGWDKNSPPPALPEEVVTRTSEKYAEALARLTRK